MTTHSVSFPYDGDTSMSVGLEQDCLGTVVSPQDVPAPSNEDAVIAAALDSPLGAPRLEESVTPNDRVLILSDDNTRPTPTDRILPHVLRRLAQAGVPDTNIQIMIASGTHRPMTAPEIARKLGGAVVQRFDVTCHDCYDTASLVQYGISADGVEVWLNRAVAQADFVIGIGNVVPHPHAGWAGGAKILYPGVAGAATVAAFHRVGAADPVNYMGRDDAPARRALESLADTAGLHFVINTVLTRDHRLYRVHAGHHRLAQQAAQREARDVYGIPVRGTYDIVVASSYPAYLEFWQAAKGFFAAEPITAPGGTIILVTPCPEGIGVTHPLQVQYLSMPLADLVRHISSGEVEDPIGAAVCAKVAHIKSRIRGIIVSPGLSQADVRAMGFDYYVGLPAALDAALAQHGRRPRVAVVTHGGESFTYSV